MSKLENDLTGFFDSVNRVLVHFATLVSVWAADGVVAWLAAENMIKTLQFSRPVSILTGIALEGVGVVVSACALRVHRYNQSRSANEPPALEWLAWAVMAVQFGVGMALILVNAVFVDQMVFGLVTLGLLSTTGTVAHMLAEDVAVREARQQKEQATSAPTMQIAAAPVMTSEVINQIADIPARSVKQDVLDCYRANPLATQPQVAEAVGVSRQRVGQLLAELIAEEKAVKANGQGVRVLC